MNIVFIGTVNFSYHCLEQVLKNKGQVKGIVTLKKSDYNNDFKDITPIANHFDIPIHYCNHINDKETVNWIKNKFPDIIFCFGFSQFLKNELLDIPPMGILGTHPTLLPKNRGNHPIIWALALGLNESGLSFFFLEPKIDSGRILSQKQFEITKNDTASTIYEKMKEVASVQIATFMPQLISGNYKTVKQNHKDSNVWRKRSIKDGIIDWRMNCDAIFNLIRALTKPYPSAIFYHKKQIIKVWKAKVIKQSIPRNVEPGKILHLINQKPVIKCYDGAIQLLEYEPKIDFICGEYLS